MSEGYILDFPVKQEIIDRYNTPDRHYHDIKHIEEMLTNLRRFRHVLDSKQYWSMALAIIFHGTIQERSPYKSSVKLSYEFAEKHIKENEEFYSKNYEYDFKTISRYIEATDKDLLYWEDTILILYIKLSRFLEDDESLRQRHIQLLNESPTVKIKYFIETRKSWLSHTISVLNSLDMKTFYNKNFTKIIEGIERSITILENMAFSVGVYPGSFNPLHKGHRDIIKQAQNVFDRVILVQAKNTNKKEPEKLESKEFIIKEHDGFIKDVFDEISQEYDNVSMIRGLRNSNDLQYEMDYKQSIIDLGFNYPIVYFISDPNVRHISSTSIRSAQKLNLNYEKWV